jgi:hypothetical protein
MFYTCAGPCDMSRRIANIQEISKLDFLRKLIKMLKIIFINLFEVFYRDLGNQIILCIFLA